MDEILARLKEKGIQDPAVLEVMERVDRMHFVNEPFKDCAYRDIPLTIGRGQTISQPSVVGLMTQELDVKPSHRVLEIGTGSGYQTVILSYLAKHVFTTERIKSLHLSAKKLISQKYRRNNITFVFCDGALGLEDAGQFDRVIVTAAAKEVPQILLRQLKPDGIMVLPVETSKWEQQLMVLKNTDTGADSRFVCPVRFVPLRAGVEEA